MRNTVVQLAMILAMLLAGTGASAMQHEATVDKGKALFNDPKLGTAGTTCNDCHKDGAGLAQAAERKDLADIVNGCIKANLKGKALKLKSVEMQSLLLYIRSLGAVKQPADKKDKRHRFGNRTVGKVTDGKIGFRPWALTPSLAKR